MKNSVNLLSLQKGEVYQEFLSYTSFWQLNEAFLRLINRILAAFSKLTWNFHTTKKTSGVLCKPFYTFGRGKGDREIETSANCLKVQDR